MCTRHAYSLVAAGGRFRWSESQKEHESVGGRLHNFMRQTREQSPPTKRCNLCTGCSPGYVVLLALTHKGRYSLGGLTRCLSAQRVFARGEIEHARMLAIGRSGPNGMSATNPRRRDNSRQADYDCHHSSFVGETRTEQREVRIFSSYRTLPSPVNIHRREGVDTPPPMLRTALVYSVAQSGIK